ncbi:hypothetical protein ABFS82_07G115400 [Erythranthe guttata]
MKNVAKCDTWCELQNPVNHRVFERKFRPKPLGRGHVCLGVTHCVAPPPLAPSGRDRGADIVVVEFSTRLLRCLTASSARASPTTQRRHIGAFDCDPRSGRITR